VRNPRRTLARILVPAVAVTLLFPAALLSLPTPALAGDTTGPCDLTRKADETIRSKMKRLIECATDRWEVRGGARRAICVAVAESDLNPQATSAGGDFVGLFQHMADAWPDRFDTWTRPSWNLNESALSGRSNTIVTIRMVNADGWGPWRGAGDCFGDGTRARGSLR
jgi:hypothetical protein